MTTMVMPRVRPVSPHFSSGPCAKRPGWSLNQLSDAPLGRSHRAKPGKAKLKASHRSDPRGPAGSRRLQDRHRAGLRYRRGRDGDVVAAGAAAGRSAGLGKLWRGLGHRCGEAAEAKGRAPHHGRLWRVAGPLRGRSKPRRGVHLERHHIGRARARCRLDRRRPRRAHDLRCHLGGLRPAAGLRQARCRDLLLAEGARRRGGAWHADPFAARRRAFDKPIRRPGRCPRFSA
jgi:hypothetical protein